MWQVDGFGDRAADERLCCAHHTNMTMRMDISLALFAAFVSAIKYRKVFCLKERSSFHRHRSAYIIICCFNFFIAKSKRFKQTPFEIKILLRFESKTLQAFLTQCVYIEDKTNLECAGNSCI